MCGRFQLTATGEELAEAFGLDEVPSLPDRYNIAPGQEIAVVRADARGRRRLSLVQWGLVPRFAEDPSGGPRSINARLETADRRSAFRESFRARRCLVPARGFYEWGRRGGRRQPYLIRRPDRGLLAFAGLWDEWRAPGGDRLQTCAILTTEPSEVVAPIHDRMPLMLSPAVLAAWLDPSLTDPARLREGLGASPPLEALPVSTWVNDVAHDDARCAEPLTADALAREPAQKRLF